MLKITITILMLSAFNANADTFKVVEKQVGSVKIPFVQNAEHAEDFYTRKADYALIEKMAPLSTSQMMSLKPNDFSKLSMEEFDQIYARLGSGPMPLGDYKGYILQKPQLYYSIKNRLLKMVKGATELSKVISMFCGKESEDCFFEVAWNGKRFMPKDDMDRIETMTTFNPAATDTKFKNILPSFITKNSLFEKAADIKDGLFDLANVTLFPMHVYCGISQSDVRRESIITDASYADDFSNYIGLRDEMITRKGMNITEEFRMVRPGLYIGKVFTNKLFLFNLAIEISGTKIPTETANACFDGTKTR